MRICPEWPMPGYRISSWKALFVDQLSPVSTRPKSEIPCQHHYEYPSVPDDDVCYPDSRGVDERRDVVSWCLEIRFTSVGKWRLEPRATHAVRSECTFLLRRIESGLASRRLCIELSITTAYRMHAATVPASNAPRDLSQWRSADANGCPHWHKGSGECWLPRDCVPLGSSTKAHTSRCGDGPITHGTPVHARSYISYTVTVSDGPFQDYVFCLPCWSCRSFAANV